MQSAPRRFVTRVLLVATLFYAASWICSIVLDKAIDWRVRQDPRSRLLWDQRTDVADVILLGDSVLVSGFVNSPDETLWTVLQRTSGMQVFNGSLTGADPPDFINGALLLEKNGTRGATVIVDVMPTRFFQKNPPDPVEGNYPGQFARLAGYNLPTRALSELARPLLILNPDIVLALAYEKERFGVGNSRDRVWNKDGNLARERFNRFESQVLDSDARDFDWIVDLDRILERSHNNLVVLITPINLWLIREYAATRAEGYIGRFSKSRDALVDYLSRNKIGYIDATSHGRSENFVDLVHLNASGDEMLAGVIASYLASPVQTSVDAGRFHQTLRRSKDRD